MDGDEWGVLAPATLQKLCADYLLDNLQIIANYIKVDNNTAGFYSLKSGLILPQQICDQLYKLLHQRVELCEDTICLFCDAQRTSLRSMDFDATFSLKVISNFVLEKLLHHEPTEVHIGRLICNAGEMLDAIARHSSNLLSLSLGMNQLKLSTRLKDKIENLKRLADCKNLRRLVLYGDHFSDTQMYEQVLDSLTDQLTCLDLWNLDMPFTELEGIEKLTKLTSLVLHNVNLGDLEEAFSAIGHLQNLRLLDLSQIPSQAIVYDDAVTHMRSFLPRMRHLSHLDLSGTNLAGSYVDVRNECGDAQSCCPIPGLEGRNLQFLGLLSAFNDPCQRPNLPAVNVAGSLNETQVLTAIRAYMHRPEMLSTALDYLFPIFRYEVVDQQQKALQLLLDAMCRHAGDKHIQISASASLFYLVKGPLKEEIARRTHLTRRIIRILVAALETHGHDATMVRNAALTIGYFSIPHSVLFIYLRLMKVLLKIVDPPNKTEGTAQRFCMYLLNSLVCQVDSNDKQAVGRLGAIETMLSIIATALQQDTYNEVIELAWSTMWNVTDETALNCQLFVENEGMDLFLKCLEKYEGKIDLIRNMMGLLGNVAEVKDIRPFLTKSVYLKVFTRLLDSTSDRIEVSYNACGVLSHIMSDGPKAWTVGEPSREHVIERMSATICGWPMKINRNINYRSFEPIVRLLKNEEGDLVSQHWAMWALCNLTKMYRIKYCPLVERENGCEFIARVTENPRHPAYVRQWAQQVLKRCASVRGTETYESSGDEVDEENQ